MSRTSTERKSSTAPAARSDQRAPTYQDVLDEALVETFPASDPISPGTAARREQRISTEKNPADWVQKGTRSEPPSEPHAGTEAPITVHGASQVFTKPAQEVQPAQHPAANLHGTRQHERGSNGVESPLPAERVSELRLRLEDRARALVEEMRAIQEDRPATPTLTQTNVADDAEHGEQRTHDAVRGAEQDRDAGELRDIAAALAKMDEGRYGVCLDCDASIPFARLLVQPSALRCIDCQERYERTHPAEVKAVLMR